MKKIAVLGGSGFVGRRLCPELAAAGHSVFSISRSPVVIRDPRVNYIDCNFDNIYQLGELYQSADYIFHLAWDTTPATSSQQSSLEVTANLLPSLRLLEYLEHQCTATLVYVSSGGAIYGNEGDTARNELDVISPISYYGASKASFELFLQAYCRQTDNRVLILRPSNLYGPGQLAKQQFGFVPTLLKAMQEDRAFYLMGDGQHRRDFLFIDDFVALCRALLENDQGSGGSCDIYNVGSGEEISLMDVIGVAENVTGSKARLEYKPARKVDVRSIVLDSSKASVEFSWTPATQLDKGLHQTWDWMVSG